MHERWILHSGSISQQKSEIFSATIKTSIPSSQNNVNDFNAQEVLRLAVIEARNLNHEQLPLIQEARAFEIEMSLGDVGPLPVMLPVRREELDVEGGRE